MTKSLKYFILTSESKKLFRQFMKLTRSIENKVEQKDMRIWIRDDFQLNKNVTNELDIKSLHIRARKALEDLNMSIRLSRSKDGTN